ncbi:MAG: metal-binding protein [Capsulimonadales bacterium]|nr:metal-binding protein [Capsulimonadales bacterium]
MPSGKVHDRITVVGAIVALPAYFLLAPSPPDPLGAVTLTAATLFSGFFLSPDLDLDSSVYRRWGPFRILWWPYQKLMPHRSILSHSFVLGPALRLLYFVAVVWASFRIMTWIASYFLKFDRNGISRQYADSLVGLWQNYPWHVQMAALGIFLGTALHIGADIVVSRWPRRWFRRKRRRQGR